MAQIKTGTVSVTNGSTTVIGDGVDWTLVSAVACQFVVGERPQIYSINGVTPPGESVSGEWELELAAPYGEATGEGLNYTIVKDFSVNLGLPLINPGDVETATLLTRAFLILDQAIVFGDGSADLEFVGNTAAPHGFDIGSVVRFNNTGWVLAHSGDEENSVVMGVVSAILTPQSFKYVIGGFVTGITGATLVAGDTYYLKSTADQINFTNDIGDTSLKIPIFVATNTTDAFLLIIGGGASSAVFEEATSGDAGLAGSVPAPPAGSQAGGASPKVLMGSGWEDNTPLRETVVMKHLKKTPAWDEENWASLLAEEEPESDDFSIYQALLSLNRRIEQGGAKFRKYAVFNHWNRPWVIPADATRIRIKCWGAGGGGKTGPVGGNGSGGGAGAYVHAEFDVADLPSRVLTLTVGDGGAADTDGGHSYVLNSSAVELIKAKGGLKGTTDTGGAGATECYVGGILAVTDDDNGVFVARGGDGFARNDVNCPRQGGSSYQGYAGLSSPGAGVVSEKAGLGAGGPGGQLSGTAGGEGGDGQVIIEWY